MRWIHHILSFCSSVGGHLDCFLFFVLIWVILLWTSMCRVFFCRHMFLYFLEIYLGVEFLGHVITFCVQVWGTATVFQSGCTIFYSHLQYIKVTNTFKHLFLSIFFFYFGHPSGWRVLFHCDFAWHFSGD